MAGSRLGSVIISPRHSASNRIKPWINGVFVIGVGAQMIDAEIVRLPGVNLFEVICAVNRKIPTVAVPAQFVGFGDEDGDFDALSLYLISWRVAPATPREACEAYK